MGIVGDLVLLVVSGVIGVFAVLAQIYMVGFFMDMVVPITVDHSPAWHDPPRLERWPLVNNFILLLLFSIQHSAMPRGLVKKMISLLSEDYYKPLYSLVSAVSILASYYFWVPVPYIVWNAQEPAVQITIYGISALCWSGLALSLLCLDPLGLLGIGHPLHRLMGWEIKSKLVRTGLYGFMRHPVYSFLILSIWVTPTMTVGHLLLSVVYTAYILIAVPLFEEPDLIKHLESEYTEYIAMPRRPVKKMITLCLDYYRPLYSLISAASSFATFYYWVPIPHIVWNIQVPAMRITLYGINALCWSGMAASMMCLDPLEPLGIRRPLYQLMGWETKPKLVSTGLYRFMRHPIYSFFILSIWITPTMTVGHVLLSVLYTTYVLIAVPPFEELDLIKHLGSEYTEYMKTTPACIPNFPFFTRKKSIKL